MRLTMSSPAAELPITLDDAKIQCEVELEDTEHDPLIEGLIAAAVDYLDGPSGILGRAIVAQEWLLELEGWPDGFNLPIEPVQSVVVRYLNQEGVETDLSAEFWDLDQLPSRRTRFVWVKFGGFPVLQSVRYPVRVYISAGFGAPAAVPHGLKVAIKLLVSHWYKNGGFGEAGLPKSIDTLLSRWRVVL